MACAFGTVSHVCATKCEKCEKAKRTYYVERVWECERVFELHRAQGHDCFFSLRGLHSVVVAFMLCLPFRFHTRLLALSSSLPSQYLPFWHRGNETTSATTVLRTVNLYESFCKQDILIAFLNGTDVCAQTTPSIAFLKRDGSQSHTPPTENTHCKISSLALRHSAIADWSKNAVS